jgi:hypothetical protein
MNRNKLKTYAPQARRDFIQAVTDRATQYGLTANKIEPMTEQGEVVLIAGKPFPKSDGVKRKKLEARIQKLGFEQTMEAIAYTWFNRLVAIRFMELHGYLEHGFRVLSHPEGHSQPEILEHAQHVDLPGLDQKEVVELKLDGTKEEELFRLLLIAQCNALHKALPFLFESINDEAELLLPDHLLHSDSLIRNLVNEIDEADWQEVEIIGWLYQFYISEKKDEVIGKVVASEDIPAATQLFTPNWIVKYLVQNTLGRQWMATYPNSPLKGQMEYYIEPAEQTPEVQEQLKAITPTSLNPEELTLLDPACGSGHILVEAYDLFKAIYQERGYRAKDIPAFILQKNLFGLEIDDRAAQLAAFALMMKARADDRRIFDSEAKPNILAFVDSQGMNAADITFALNAPMNKEDVPKEYLFEEIQDEKDGLFSQKALAEKRHVSQADIASLLVLFENATTFGSLIQVPPKLASKLPEIEQRLNAVLKHGDLTHAPARVLKPLLQQAWFLARQYDAVVANPPYMGSKYYCPSLRTIVTHNYKESKADLITCFMQRADAFVKPTRFIGMITLQNWMFLSSFEAVRVRIITNQAIETMIHNGRGAFGVDYGTTCFVIRNARLPEYQGVFRRLLRSDGKDSRSDELRERFFSVPNYTPRNSDLSHIPGCPLAYWASPAVRSVFCNAPNLASVGRTRVGLQTGENERFLRLWHEVSLADSFFKSTSRMHAQESGKKWFPCNKGGPFRKWYGNNFYVVNWKNDGEDIRRDKLEKLRLGQILESNSQPKNTDAYFREGITWTTVTISSLSMRHSPASHMFETKGAMFFCDKSANLRYVLGLANSCVAMAFLSILSPTIDFHEGPFLNLPLILGNEEEVGKLVEKCVQIAQDDWNSSELSWDCERPPIVELAKTGVETISQCQMACEKRANASIEQMRAVQRQLNQIFIDTYGLHGELSADVPDDEITLYRPSQEEDVKQLLSYAIGCMMGRYSLDKPGLIYAHSGNQGFEVSQYKIFQADEDGILPLTEFNWFPDDAASRFEKFIATAWPAEHLNDNLEFVAENLGPKKGESPRETLRRYVAADFYKHHLTMYKRRPIYWLFSSGKQRGFQALVYLHRYNEGTLARMRTDYVIPLLGKMAARIDHLTDDIAAASSSQHKKRLESEKATITKQLAEVQSFDEKLRHCADQRIKLDLDDGVKVNYTKFGDLLVDVKAICGTKDEE